ncbi:MAG: MipA/OmpV family protein [Acidiferrobacterales bacterium]|nr:MipA/OmpV family protein [Acidiferrobacterales bacterium]
MTILTRKKSTLFVALSVFSAVNAVSLSASGSDAIDPGDSESTWVVGGAVGALNNPYSGEGDDVWISPTIRYNGKRVFVKEDSVNIHITKSNGFSAGLKFALDAGFLIDRDNFKDNAQLAGLTERDGTIMGGIYVNHDSDLGRLSFSALTDAANEHNGRSAQLKYTFDLKAGDWNINPELGAEWLSDDYVNHYAGVSETEATSSRFLYRADDAIVAFAGIRARYDFTDHWDINLRTGVSKLGSEFKDSPIIEDDLVYQASVGINYNF